MRVLVLGDVRVHIGFTSSKKLPGRQDVFETPLIFSFDVLSSILANRLCKMGQEPGHDHEPERENG